MFKFLIVASALIMLIPVNESRTNLSQELPTTSQTISLAQGVYQDMSTFCQRNEKTCEAGRQLATVFEHKLRSGATMLLAYLETDKPQSTDSVIVTGSVTTPDP